MKREIQPVLNEVIVKMTDGTTFKTMSTYPHPFINLDVDPKTHRAWNMDKEGMVRKNVSSMLKFNKKFQNVDFGSMFESNDKKEESLPDSSSDESSDDDLTAE